MDSEHKALRSAALSPLLFLCAAAFMQFSMRAMALRVNAIGLTESQTYFYLFITGLAFSLVAGSYVLSVRGYITLGRMYSIPFMTYAAWLWIVSILAMSALIFLGIILTVLTGAGNEIVHGAVGLLLIFTLVTPIVTTYWTLRLHGEFGVIVAAPLVASVLAVSLLFFGLHFWLPVAEMLIIVAGAPLFWKAAGR